ncbi:MAG: hypothetical protein M3Z00_10855 [Actinomycetota bacterium]|nr:hypothetical protein [Actinomycetota bacterium]
MTSPWFGDRESRRNRREPDLTPARSALDGAAQALIDLDTRQGYVDEAIRTAHELGSQDDLGRSWAPIAEKSFAASAQYMEASARYSLTDVYGKPNAGLDVEAARRAFADAHRSMADAAAAVDSFYRRHRERIESGKRAMAAIPLQIDTAKKAATAATDQAMALAQQNPALLDYRSVSSAMDGLSAAVAQLNSAGGLTAEQQAAAAVQSAANSLSEALHDAPQLAERTRTSLPAVRTRLDSLATRMQRLQPAQSALWREFSQANSADLGQHGNRAQAALAAARAAFDTAGQAVAAGDPETARDAIATARSHAADADRLIDDVTDRLDTLRSVKADPRRAEQPVRFAIRDAQRLVVDRGLAGEWGSALDAQSARVDRAVAGLDVPHPDYWAMLTELQAVRAFVADIVDRVRQQAHKAAGS